MLSPDASPSQLHRSVGPVKLACYEQRLRFLVLKGNLQRWLGWVGWRRRARAICRTRAERATRTTLAKAVFKISQLAASLSAVRSAATRMAMQQERWLMTDKFCEWVRRVRQVYGLIRIVKSAYWCERASIYQRSSWLRMQVTHKTAAQATPETVLDRVNMQSLHSDVSQGQQHFSSHDVFRVLGEAGPLSASVEEKESMLLSYIQDSKLSRDGVSVSETGGPRQGQALCESPKSAERFGRSISNPSRPVYESQLRDTSNECQGVSSKVCLTAAFFRWAGLVMRMVVEQTLAMSLRSRMEKFISRSTKLLLLVPLFKTWSGFAENKHQLRDLFRTGALGKEQDTQLAATLRAFFHLSEYGRRSKFQKQRLNLAVRRLRAFRAAACLQEWTLFVSSKDHDQLLDKVIKTYLNRQILSRTASLWRARIAQQRKATNILDSMLLRQSKFVLLRKAFVGFCSVESRLYNIHEHTKQINLCCRCLHLWRRILFDSCLILRFESIMKIKEKQQQRSIACHVFQRLSRRHCLLQIIESLLKLQRAKIFKKRCTPVLLGWKEASANFRKVLTRLSFFYCRLRRSKMVNSVDCWAHQVFGKKSGKRYKLLTQKVLMLRLYDCLTRKVWIVLMQSLNRKLQMKRLHYITSRKRIAQFLAKVLLFWKEQILFFRSLVVSVASLRLRQSLSRLLLSYQRWKIHLISIASLHQHSLHRLHLKQYRCLVSWKRVVYSTNLLLMMSERQNLYINIKKKQRYRCIMQKIFWNLSEKVLARRPGWWVVCEARGPTLLKKFQVQKVCLVNRHTSNFALTFEHWKRKSIDALIAKNVLKFLFTARHGRYSLETQFWVFFHWKQECVSCRLIAVERGYLLELYSILCELLEVYGEPFLADFKRVVQHLSSARDLIYALEGIRTRLCDLKRVSEVQGTLPPRVINYGQQPKSHLLTILGKRDLQQCEGNY